MKKGRYYDPVAGMRMAEQHLNGDNMANRLAYLYCTDIDPRIRNGEKGLALLNTHRDNQNEPMLSESYAACHAETGAFENAVQSMDRAIARKKNRMKRWYGDNPLDRKELAILKSQQRCMQKDRPFRN